MGTPKMDSKTELAACWHPLQTACLPGTLQEALKDGKNWAQTVGRVVHIVLIASPVGSTKPSDLHLFRHHKKHFDGKQFARDANMKQAVNSWLQRLESFLLHQDTSHGGTNAYMSTLSTLRSDVYHLLTKCHVYTDIRKVFLAVDFW